MDTSETYIKMRLAAIPDLGLGHKPKMPLHHFATNIYVDAKGDLYYSNENNECFQLERQDQLQEMVGKTFIALAGFEYWMNNGGSIFTNGQFGSMEQLWIAYVQGKKYNKVWNGTEWYEDSIS